MKRIRGKTQRAIAWVLVIVTGVFIPGLTITTHVCHARNVREIWLLSTNDGCCDKESDAPKETRPIENLPACCAALQKENLENVVKTSDACCIAVPAASCTENAKKSKESSLLNAQTEPDHALTKVKSAKTAKHCCEKDVKVFQIKDSFRKAAYNKDFGYSPLFLLTPGLYFVFPPEIAALKWNVTNAPPLPYGKTLCYLYQTLLN